MRKSRLAVGATRSCVFVKSRRLTYVCKISCSWNRDGLCSCLGPCKFSSHGFWDRIVHLVENISRISWKCQFAFWMSRGTVIRGEHSSGAMPLQGTTHPPRRRWTLPVPCNVSMPRQNQQNNPQSLCEKKQKKHTQCCTCSENENDLDGGSYCQK